MSGDERSQSQTRSGKSKPKGGAAAKDKDEPSLREVLDSVNMMNKSINTRLDDIDKKYDQVFVKLEERLSNMDEKFVDIQNTVVKCRDDVNSLHTKYDDLKASYNDLKKSHDDFVNKTMLRFDREEQYSRRCSLRIAGLKVHKDESTDDAVLRLASVIKASTEQYDISRSHFTKGKQHNGAKPIIIRFTSYRARLDFITKRKALRILAKDIADGTADPSLNEFSNIFINEDLTSRRLKLLMRARKCVKDKKIWSVWTNDGNLWYKVKENGELERINDENDLMQIERR